jgi:phospholipase C
MDGIDHIIVLMLENRSFDHLLGSLDHPKKTEFKRAFLDGQDTRNPLEGRPDVEMRYQDDKSYMTEKKPGHSHEDVMSQMFDMKLPEDTAPGMRGFASNYVKEKEATKPEDVMRAYREDQAPVINKLAKHFQLCTNWFCSVPGETWPNRFFAMAGESAGHVDNAIFDVPFQLCDSIFPLLQKEGVEWRIYHDGPCLAMLLKGMLDDDMKKRFSRTEQIRKDIKNNELPSFSWIEPDHFGKDSTSQHPGFIDKKHDAWGFIGAEKLIADIYNELRQKPELFEKTLFLVTYDEHGGFYDHVSPPNNFPPPYAGHLNEKYKFEFKQLGPRVPTLLINPRIEAAWIDDTEYDHTAILKMVADRFLHGTAKFTSERVKKSSNPIVKLKESGNASNMPVVTCLEADDRPPNWKLALANHLDDLQISMMKGLLKLRGETPSLADIMTNKELAFSETDRRFALLEGYIANHEGRPEGLVVNKLLAQALGPNEDNVVDLVHGLTNTLLGREGAPR